MLVHYLGLDHIGHVEGNASPKIHTKLREMDKVISDMVLSVSTIERKTFKAIQAYFALV